MITSNYSENVPNLLATGIHIMKIKYVKINLTEFILSVLSVL